MKDNQKYLNCQNLSEALTQTYKDLTVSVIMALDRTKTTDFETNDINNLITDICSTFPKMEIKSIQKAIRNGSLGKYGRTYKFSTQEVCIWIRQYLKETNKRYL